jgi:type I restriction enzyme S subunit
MNVESLPVGWILTTIDQVLKPQSDGKILHQGWSPQCLKEPAKDGEWGVLKTTAIQDGYFLCKENKKLPDNMISKPRIEVKTNDLLLTNAGPRARCGVAALVRDTPHKLMLSGKMYRMRFDKRYIVPNFIEAWLRTSRSQSELNARKTGISESGLNMTQDRFKTLPVIIPPVAEQKQIANKLEKLLAQVDTLKVRIDAIPSILTQFRQSILVAAVSGRLTKEWDNSSGLYFESLDSEICANKKLNKIASLSDNEINLAKSLHGDVKWERWRLYPMEQLVDSVRGIPYGIVQTGEHTDGGIPTIRCGDVKPFAINTKSLKRVSYERSNEYKRTLLRGGEVLLAIRGTVGNAALAIEQLEGFNISREVAMIPVRNNINGKYISILFQSPGGYRCLAEKVRGVAQKGINLADVKRFVTPLPTYEEQTEIVRRVDQLFTFADQIEQRVKDAQSLVNNLTQSILAKAFRGELTIEWRQENPDLITGENSAEALLNRIKAERQSAPLKTRTRKKRA